jgi:DNA-binding NarL/FixJ family response regulator
VQSLQLAMSYGAYGYIEKTDSIEELKKAIVRVQASGVHFSPGPGRLLTTLIRSGPVASGVEARNELRLLELFARGFSIKAAAFEMGITNQKAYRIRQSLMHRAQARNVQDLTRYAIEIGLLGAGRLGPVPKA